MATGNSTEKQNSIQQYKQKQLECVFGELVNVALSIEMMASHLVSESSADKETVGFLSAIESLGRQVGILAEFGNRQVSGLNFNSIRGDVESYLMPESFFEAQRAIEEMTKGSDAHERH